MRTNEKLPRLASTVAAVVVMLVGLFFAASLCCGGPAEFLAFLHGESCCAYSEPMNTIETVRELEVRK